MSSIEALLALALALWLFALALDLWQRTSAVVLQPARPAADAPQVAVIVPARDEEHQISACLRSLLAQDWPALRVVCVDDRSTDQTLALARDLARGDERLTVVAGAELPAGWLGKNFANAQGVRAAGAPDWYLFTDADTVHAPGALAAALGAARRANVGLYSLLTRLVLGSFWERALQSNIIATIISAFPLALVNDPKSAVAIANGQYLLARRDAYEAAGGHEAIRDRVADDLELARLFKARGLGVRIDNGRELVSVRMYQSLREIWWGFAKNAAMGAGGPLVALCGATFILFLLLPFAALPWALVEGQRAPALLAGAGVLVAVVQRAHVYGFVMGIPARWALLLPLAQVMFAGIVVHSALRMLRGKGPLWKGREYPAAR